MGSYKATTNDGKCIFCEIVSGVLRTPGIFWEDDEFLAFLAIDPNTPGFTCVIPKQHFGSDVLKMPDEVLQRFVVAAKKVALVLENYYVDVGRVGLIMEGTGIDHAHIKLVPFHGTENLKKGIWEQILSDKEFWFEKYEGWISSGGGPLADKDELRRLAGELRVANNKMNNINIFLLSRTDNLQKDLQEAIREEIVKRGNTVAYISSEPQNNDRQYYHSTVKDYSKISSDIQVDYFDLSKNFSEEDLAKLLDYRTIYLSGGNTFVFMDSARKRNLYPILKKHLESGGLLIGASAGAIMMTPSVGLASFGDENIPNLKDISGFSFIDFEFWPHFKDEHTVTLTQYMNVKNGNLYACMDGSGIFYSNGKIKLFGEVPKLF